MMVRASKWKETACLESKNGIRTSISAHVAQSRYVRKMTYENDLQKRLTKMTHSSYKVKEVDKL